MAQTNRNLAAKHARAKREAADAGALEYGKPAYYAKRLVADVAGPARPLTCSGATLPPGVTMCKYLRAMW